MPTLNKWSAVKSLFDAALELDVSDREAFVMQASSGDEFLNSEVNSLLVADAAAGTFLDSDVTVVQAVSPLHVSHKQLRPGFRLCDRFEIRGYLGAGGMGYVYEALDLELGQSIAIKAIRDEISNNERVLESFRREVYAARRITHPNVCRTFDLERHVVAESRPGETETVITFLTMELLEGETLAERLTDTGPLNSEDAWTLALQTSQALQAAHNAGIIHCDLKPSNIFLSRSSQLLRAVVTDFGISKFTNGLMSAAHANGLNQSLQTTHLLGTPPYMAPEQLEHGVSSESSDLYSLGLVLYEAVTGLRAFGNDQTVDRETDKVAGVLTPLTSLVPDIRPEYHAAVTRCLKVDPAERFGSAGELLDALTSPANRRQHAIAVSSPEIAFRKWWTLALGCLIAIAIGTLFYLNWFYTNRSGAHFDSIAILPFVGQPKDSSIDYLSGGLTTALTNDLSRVSGLTVTAESVARRLDTTHLNPQQAGRNLHVSAIVTGSIAKKGQMLSVSVELVNSANGAQIWGTSYSKEVDALASLQQQIVTDIAFQLRIVDTRGLAKRLKQQYSTTSTAYDEYAKGRYDLAKRTTPGFESALNHFQAAIAHDPRYAPAFAGLADSYTLMAFNRVQPTIVLLNKGKDAAKRALELDSTLGEAYTSLAMTETLGEFDWSNAEESYKRSLMLSPNYIQAHTTYAWTLLLPLGRFSEANAQFEYARQLDPESMATLTTIALANYYSRHFDQSINEANALHKKYPRFEIPVEILAYDYLARGMPDAAVQIIAPTLGNASKDALLIRNSLLGIAFARLGNREKALGKLNETKSAVERGEELHFLLGCLYGALGDKKDAIQHLEQAYEHRQTSVLFLRVEPLMDCLRGDSRFKQLLARMNLN